MNLKADIIQEKDYLIELRRWFHQHPEPSLKEYQTAIKIEEELDRYQIPHQRIGETGVYAWIKGKKGNGKCIALRADIDALAMDDLKEVEYHSKNEGFAHACGHDGHTATLLVAAKILKSKENEFAGEIRLFFQQAEEIGQGARQFVSAGLLEDVSRVYGAHVSSAIEVGNISLTPGPVNASCDYFKIEITGKGAHVSTPQKGIDALYIASQLVVSLQSIIARNIDPIDSALVGIGTLKAGTQYNIVAENAEIEGTIRCFSKETRAYIYKRVEEIASHTAQMYGAKAKLEFKQFADPLINDKDVIEELKFVAQDIVGNDHIIQQEKMLQADDFADYLAKVKGAYAFIGSKNINQPNTCVAHHHGLFDMDEKALLISLQLYIDYTLNYLTKE